MVAADGPSPTRERILAAALDLVGREGIEALTTRKVAEAAGVNLGLVHYHFESKSALLDEVLERFLDDLTARLKVEPRAEAPEVFLVEIFCRAFERILERPGLFFGILGQVVRFVEESKVGTPQRPFEVAAAESGNLGPLLKAQVLMVGRVKSALALRLGADEVLLSRRALQLFTSIFHPLLFTPMARILYGVDIADPAGRRSYVEGAVNDAFRPALDSRDRGQ